MRIWLGLGALVGTALLSVAAQAQTSPQTLSQGLASCLTIVSAVQRLGCYDRLAHGVSPSASMSAAMAAPALAAPVMGGAPPPPVMAQQFGAENLPRSSTAGAQRLDTISSTITDFQTSSLGKFTVTLANGQVWQQVESDTMPMRFSPKSVHAVTISRGFLGSYNLKFDRYSLVYKVLRLR